MITILENSPFYLKTSMQTNIYSPFPRVFALFSLSLLILCVFLLSSCAQLLPPCNACSTPPISQLDGRWELLRWNYPPDIGNKVQLRKIPHGDNGEPIFLEFNETKKIVSGYSGCNRFFGTITLDAKEAVIIGKLGGTRMMCIEPYRMELERDFLQQLQDYRTLQIKEENMLLIGRSGDVLMFGKRARR